MGYTKKQLKSLTENYITQKLDTDVDAFLFKFSPVLGFSAMDVLTYINNSNQQQIKKLELKVKAVKHIDNVHALRKNIIVKNIINIITSKNEKV